MSIQQCSWICSQFQIPYLVYELAAYYNILMSLLIVGSCSRITQNIIHHLSKQQQYRQITITDLLPTYDFHRRYYKLRKTLKDQKSTLQVDINKLTRVDELQKQIKSHDDLLFVTHDYYHTVTSKTKLMELTAQFAKQKSEVFFATPIEYDHFEFNNPEQHYLNSQQKIRTILPNSTFIRSDIQDNTEIYAYIHKSKTIWQEKLLTLPNSFRPKVVSSQFYAQQVADTLKARTKGEVITVQGDKERHYTQVAHNRDIQNYEMDHQICNIRNIVTKFKGPQDKHSKLVVSRFGV